MHTQLKHEPNKKDLHSLMIDYNWKNARDCDRNCSKISKTYFEKYVNQSYMFLHVEQKHTCTRVTNAAFKFLFAINSIVCKDFFDESK